jgi:hypothetical protein
LIKRKAFPVRLLGAPEKKPTVKTENNLIANIKKQK